MLLKAIETEYAGHRFRSRTEARWAVLFDDLGVKWEYEKEGYELGNAGRYLPDFWLPAHDFFVEVKGAEVSPADEHKINTLSQLTKKPVIVVHDIPAPGVFSNELGNTKLRFDMPILTTGGRLDNLIPAFNGAGADHWGVELACPICRDNYTHFGHPEQISGEDGYKAWSGRGDAVKLSMWCENGHAWKLRFGFHKGQTYLAIEGAAERCDDLVMLLANKSMPVRDRACRAARGARFEFGETPR